MTENKNTPKEKIIVRIDADLEELIPEYFDRRHQDLQSLRTALVREDYDHVRRLGHRMKGSGGGYGFPSISEIGAALETAGGEQERTAIEESLRNLADFLERVEVVYK